MMFHVSGGMADLLDLKVDKIQQLKLSKKYLFDKESFVSSETLIFGSTQNLRRTYTFVLE